MNKDSKSGILQVVRFVITGGVCFLIEFVCLVILRDTMKLPTLAATPLAFLVSVIVNYIMCVVWVFKASGNNSTIVKISFLLTSLIGLALNELFMWALGALFGEDTVILQLFGFTVSMYMLNKCISTLLVMIWNYFTKKATLNSDLLKRFAK